MAQASSALTRGQRVAVFLEQARTAVKADDWIRAGQAWVNAAWEGNREAIESD
jgi:hypothetical protein